MSLSLPCKLFCSIISGYSSSSTYNVWVFVNSIERVLFIIISSLSLHQSNITFLLNPSTRLLRFNDHHHNQNIIIIIIVRIIINNNNYKLGARTSSSTPPDNYINLLELSSPSSSPSKYIRIRICYKEIFSCPPPVTFHHTTVHIIIIILWISYTAESGELKYRSQ